MRSVQRTKHRGARATFILVLMSLLCSCVNLVNTKTEVEPPLELLSLDPEINRSVPKFNSDVIFRTVVHPDVLGLTTGMASFIPLDAKQDQTLRRRVDALIDALSGEGFYEGTYEPSLSFTARETFEQKRGNCLSFTSLFVALAREAGLDAHFQRVRGMIAYDARNGILENQQHINVLVRRSPARMYEDDIIVDFNRVRPKRSITRVISDDAAIALYLNNFGIDHLVNGNLDEAFRYLRAAIELDYKSPALWINLGTLYLRLGELENARKANVYALRLDSTNTAALAGLQIVHNRKGEPVKAKVLALKLRDLRNKNPYYHFALAQKAYARQDFRQSQTHLAQSIKLRSDDPRIFDLNGQVHHQLGNIETAIRSFRIAKTLSIREADTDYYDALIRDLATSNRANNSKPIGTR
ncbi:hypothetical protein C6500_00335 [Candidatus Poribacteria bacterium]|nr:MAG: hypothetical protein C6500_00335 [Candidatus Poribacteria bacterium]